MFDNKSYSKVKQSSPKNFGITFSIFFLLLFLYLVIFHNFYSYFFIIVSLFFLIISFLRPNYLSLLNYFWLGFGNLIAKIISPIIMFSIYYIIFSPYSLIIRLFRSSFGKNKINSSYWVKRNEKLSSMDKEY